MVEKTERMRNKLSDQLGKRDNERAIKLAKKIALAAAIGVGIAGTGGLVVVGTTYLINVYGDALAGPMGELAGALGRILRTWLVSSAGVTAGALAIQMRIEN